MNFTQTPITAIILAGGKSTRMGKDKGLLIYKKKYFIQHILEATMPLAEEIIIVANQLQYQQFGYKVYSDIFKEKGPLAGIYTGLYYSKNNFNIVLSCDIPFVGTSLLKFLIHKSKNYEVTIPFHQDKIHALIGIYQKKCISILLHELKQEQRKIKVALEKLKVNIIGSDLFSDKNFININTPTQFENLCQ